MTIRSWLDIFRRRNRGQKQGSELMSLRYVVLDTELTSLDMRTNRVLSVGAVAMCGTKIRLGEQFYRVLNPGVEVPEQTILVHGLRPQDVAEGEPPDAVLRDLLEFVDDSVIVGHVVRIDVEALNKELRSVRRKLSSVAIDTAVVYRWLELHKRTYAGMTDDQVGRMDLAWLAEKYGLDATDAHHALGDAFVTAKLWQRLLQRLEDSGIQTLQELKRIR